MQPDTNDPREQLRALWRRVLGVQDVTDDTDFIEAGGNSLLAGRLARQVRGTFDKQMRPVDILQNPTIDAQVELLSTARAATRGHPARTDDSALVPATRRQLDVYLASRLATEPCTYNIPKAVRVRGRLDVTRLMYSLTQLPRYHPALRTVYRFDHGNLVQELLPLDDVDVRHLEEPQGEPSVIARSLIRPFDLEHEAPFRAAVVELGADDHLLFLDMHHIAVDGVSEELLNDTLNALAVGETPLAESTSIMELAREVPNPQSDVADFSDLFEKLPRLDLADEQRSHGSQSNHGTVHRFSLADSPETMARRSGTSLTGFEYLTAAYALALSLHAGTDDVVIGIADSAREDPRADRTVGMLMNTLPLRLRFPAGSTVGEVLESTRLSTREAIARGPVPAALLEDPAVPRNPGLHPIFTALLVYQNHPRTELHIPGVHLEPVPVHTGTAKYDLSLYANPTDAGTEFELEYCSDLFDERFCRRFEHTLRRLFDSLAVALDRRIESIELIDHDRRLGNTRPPLAALPSEPVHERFAAVAHRSPDLTAICHGDEQMTYGELNARSDAIAAALESHPQFARGMLIGLFIDPSPDLVAAILAVLKVGGTYLPLDPSHPNARNARILDHSDCRLLVSDRDLASNLPNDVLSLQAVPASAPAPEPVSVSMNDPIYVIYTSGSSGTPKGVELTHGNIANFVDGMSAALNLDERTRICCLTTVTFDIFVLETLLPLAIGGSLVMATADEQLDLSRLGELLERHRANTLQTTPSRLSIFLNHPESEHLLSGIRTFIVGGEPMRVDAAGQVLGFASKPRLFNVYGPTETAVWSTAKQVTSIKDVSVGREILNTRLHVMDAAGRPRPVGSIGELWIGGHGVAAGYLHAPDLTARAFVPDPQHPDERAFRTGDMVRWNDRGELDCLGRLDDQVKVRGYRIELGEIEQCIAAHPAVDRCVCASKQDAINGGTEIVAFYTATGPITEAEIRATILANLPEYFLPQAYVEVSDLPMTSSGKADRKSLLTRVPDRPRSSTASKQHSGAVEFVRQQWRSALGHDSFGNDISFFEVGGTSLSLVQLHNALERAHPGIVNLAAMFSRPTVNATAELLDAAPAASPVMLEKPFLLRAQHFVADNHTPAVDIPKLRAAAERQGVTPTEFLAAAFCYLLGRLTGGRPFPWYVIDGGGETRADLDPASLRQATDIVEAAASALRLGKGAHRFSQPECGPRELTAAVQRGDDSASRQYDLVLLVDDPFTDAPPSIRTNQSRLGPRLGRSVATMYESALNELIDQGLEELR
ncbi:MAG TPA: amino acid adenylation domain-containing protein [Propionicimonas sp.]|nr:amino acid adenylation domain-containing protein [Propionicimonas sp.]